MGQAQPEPQKNENIGSKGEILKDGDIFGFQPQPKSEEKNIIDQVKLQQFNFPDPHIKYKIVPIKSDKMAFDVTTIDDEKQGYQQGDIIIWNYYGGPNQQFYFKKISKNKYNIINVATNFYLEVQGNSTQPDAIIESTPYSGNQSEVWQLLKCPQGHNVFQIRTFCGQSLTIRNFLIRNGTKIVQEHWQNKKYQKWMIIPG